MFAPFDLIYLHPADSTPESSANKVDAKSALRNALANGSYATPAAPATPAINDTFAQRRTLSGSILPRFAVTYMLCLILVGCGISTSKSVLTQHNDNGRTGAYLSETVLNPANVNASTFGLLNYYFQVHGHILAQPLYVSGLRTGFSPRRLATGRGAGLFGRNALFVATLENKIYGFDADDGTPLWTDFPDGRTLGFDLGEPSPLPMSDWKWGDRPLNDKPCGQTHGNVGIVSTPVIDPDSNTMYVVFRTGTPNADMMPVDPHKQADNVDAHYWIAAIDITTGYDKVTSIEIKADGFNANMELNRPGLLLVNREVLYIAFGAPVCDHGGNPWLQSWEKPAPHGWIFAYSAANLTQLGSFNTSKYTGAAGIWQSGNGLSADSAGYVYALTGNNSTDAYAANDQCNNTIPDPKKPDQKGCNSQKWLDANPDQTTELGDSILKLHLEQTGSFSRDYYRVGNWFRLDTGLHYPGETPTGDNPGDSDLGSGGPVVLPKSGFLIGGGKQGRLYVFDPSQIHPPQKGGGAKQAFQGYYNTWDSDVDPLDYDQAQQNGPNIHGGPVVWHPDGVNYTLVYEMPEKDYLKAYRAFDDGHVEEHPFLTTMEQGVRSPRGMPGGFSSVSANGGRNGIVWVSGVLQDEGDASTTDGGSQGRLMAFDALTLKLLWQSDDGVAFAKFVPPTIGGGKVFRVAYQNEVLVYGFKSSRTVESPRPLAASTRQIEAQWWNPNDLLRLELFMTAGDGTPVSIFWDQNCCGGWAGWFPVNPSEKPPEVSAAPSQPITAVWRPLKGPGDTAHLDVFTTDMNGIISSTFFDGQPDGKPREWLKWKDWFVVKDDASGPVPPRAAPGQPVTAVWRPAKGPGDFRHLDLFITDEHGVVQSTFFDAECPPSYPGRCRTWSKWFVVKDAAGPVPPRAAPGQPVTAVWRPAKGPNDFRHLDLFITDEHGVVQSTFFDEATPPWSKWFVVKDAAGPVPPRAAPGQPVTAVWRPAKGPNDFRHLDLFITDEHGVVQSAFFDEECPPSYPGRCPPSPGPSVPRTWSKWFAVRDAAGLAPPRAAPGQPVTAVWRPAKGPNDFRHLDLFITDEHGVVQSTFFDEEHPPSTNPSVSRSFVWFEVKSTTSEVPPHAVPGQPVTALWRANKDPNKDPRHLDLFTYDGNGVVRSTFFDEEHPPWARWFAIH